MKRRRLLSAVVTAPALTMAGCISQAEYELSEGREADCTYASGSHPGVSDFRYPEGAARSGLQRSKIVPNHQNHLEKTWESATIEHRRTRTRGENEYTSETVARFGDGDTRIRATRESGELRDNWQDGHGDTYVRATRGDSTRYYLSTYNRGPGVAVGEARYDDIIDAGQYEATDVQRVDGAVVVRYTATRLADGEASSRLVGGFDDVEEFSAAVSLQCNGIVRSADYALSGTRFDGETHVEGSSSVSNLGETTASVPSWLPDAKDRSVELNLEGVGPNDSYLAVGMERGDAIPETTAVTLGAAPAASGETATKISPGETVYLWVNDGTLHVTDGKPTEETTPLGSRPDGRYGLRMAIPDGPTVYHGDFRRD